MNHRICLTSDPMASGFPVDKSAVWVHHKRDKPPLGVARSVDSESFVAAPSMFTRDADVVVLLNLVSRIIRPGSRLKYGQFLTDPWNGPPRLSVDTHLFIVDPWRMWFHFGAVDAAFGTVDEKYHTSYRVETDWRFYLEDKAPHPCSMTRIRRYGAGVVVWRNGFRFDDGVGITVLEQGSACHSAYQQEKERAFSECRTPSALIKRLDAFAQKSCPDRSIPKDLYASSRPRIVLTDLGVDIYLAARMREDMQLTNAIAEEFA